MLLDIKIQVAQVTTIIAKVTIVSFQKFCFVFQLQYEIFCFPRPFMPKDNHTILYSYHSMLLYINVFNIKIVTCYWL